MSKVDRNVAELIIEKYAEEKGISKEEARKKYLPILIGEETEGKYSDVAKKLLSVAEILSSVKDVAKDADPATKSILTGLGSSLVTNTLSKGDEETVEAMKPVIRMVAQLKAIEAAFSGGSKDVDALKDELGKLRDELEKYRKKEDEERVKKMLDESLRERDEAINELKDTINVLMGKLEKITNPPKPEDEEALLKKVESVKSKSMNLLKDMGYEVKPTTLTREEVEELIKNQVTNLPPDQLKEILEKHGYKVVGGPIPYDEALKMVEEARNKAYDEALEDKRVEAVKDIIKDSVSQLIQLFAPAVNVIFSHGEEAEEASSESEGE